jgi:cytoskeletal protein CcmA (bactofilin family)
MSTVSSASELGNVRTADASYADAFDTSSHFDRWLQLQGRQKPLAPQELETSEDENSEIHIGSLSSSNCKVTFEGTLHFEGVLHLDGCSIGNISSPDGTLVLTKPGRIEGDINVGVAVIAGSIIGNLTATERVVLESEACVKGQIRTPELSVSSGAAFDGDCLFPANPEPIESEDLLRNNLADELEPLAMSAAA